MKIFLKPKQNIHAGFTLIETLFSILIFSAALMSLMVIAGRGINATATVREEITAHYLAQEGLETVRNVRDTNYLSGASWDAGFANAPACTQSSPCRVVYGQGNRAPTLDLCSGNACPFIQQDASTGMFTESGVDSRYSRTVYVVQGAADTDGSINEYKVVSVVNWKAKTIPRSVILETVLKKWR